MLVKLLGLQIKVIDTEGMVEVRDLTKIRLVMVLLEGIRFVQAKQVKMSLWNP